MYVAKLYMRVQDYESARNYIMMYLSEKEDSALAHKILGNALEGLGQKTKAIAAYKKSLELEATQPELLTQSELLDVPMSIFSIESFENFRVVFSSGSMKISLEDSSAEKMSSFKITCFF